MSDFYGDSAKQRLAMIEAERASALADLAAHKANHDLDSAGHAIQTIANLDAERANLARLYDSYVASQTPPAQPELTPEEKAAKPIHRMGWSDMVDMVRTSRYGKTIKPDDPHMLAGWHEANRRRNRGE
jgi:hypothetical protein